MSDTDILRPLLPQCLNGDLTQEDFNVDDAMAFGLNDADYFKKVLPSTAPGLALGGLSLLCFFIFSVWSIFHFCCKCCQGHKQEDAEQFMKSNEDGFESSLDLESHKEEKRSNKGVRVVQLIIIALALATAGVSGWGIAASIENTDSRVSGFWNIIDNIERRVDNALSTLSTLRNQLDVVQQALVSISSERDGIESLLDQFDVSSPEIKSALDNINEIQGTIQDVDDGIDDAVSEVDSNLVNTISTMQEDFRRPSLDFENKWRFVVIAILFGFMIIIALATGLFGARMTHIGWTAFFVALLWFIVMLLMLLGAGLLQGVYVVSTDTCLYAESFVLRYAMEKVDDPQRQEFIRRILMYYTSPPPAGQQDIGSVVSYVLGVDLVALVIDALQNPLLDAVASLVNNPTISSTLETTLQPATVDSLERVADLLDPMRQTVANLDNLVAHDSVIPLYESIKGFVCCDISSASNALFVSWTVVGSLGFALATVASIRIIHSSIKSKKKSE